MKNIGIHQLLPSLESGDAIGEYVRGLQAFLREQGHCSEIFVYTPHPGQRECRHFRQHRRFSSPDSVLLFHTSIGSPLARYFADCRDHKVLIHHNITPARFFAEYEPDDAWLAITARKQLAQLAGAVEAAAADSSFNAAELTELGYPKPAVIPLLFDWESLGAEPDRDTMARLDDGLNNLLFVGRIAPNKRQDELLRVFSRYRELFNREARLILVGDKTHFPAYTAELERLIRDLGLEGKTELTGKVPAPVLRAFYRRARAFICLSRHEGFGVPLVESLFYRIPVLARAAGAVASTLGEGGLITDTDDPDRLAALLDQLVREGETRTLVLRAQDNRLDYYRDFPFPLAWEKLLAPFKAGTIMPTDRSAGQVAAPPKRKKGERLF